jgi:cob(I)alamin adenosyltransferase
MKKSILYTRTGDEGTTSLVGGKRISKCDCRLDAYGTVDELNAFLGLLSESLKIPHDRQFVGGEQNRLFMLGCCLATPNDAQTPEAFKLDSSCIEHIEQEIDRIDAQLPRLKSFAIPGGSEAAARAHVCRTVCRRAEREIYRLSEREPVDPLLLKYINRLSDYLFVLARKLLQDEQIDEIFWNNVCV